MIFDFCHLLSTDTKNNLFAVVSCEISFGFLLLFQPFCGEILTNACGDCVIRNNVQKSVLTGLYKSTSNRSLWNVEKSLINTKKSILYKIKHVGRITTFYMKAFETKNGFKTMSSSTEKSCWMAGLYAASTRRTCWVSINLWAFSHTSYVKTGVWVKFAITLLSLQDLKYNATLLFQKCFLYVILSLEKKINSASRILGFASIVLKLNDVF